MLACKMEGFTRVMFSQLMLAILKLLTQEVYSLIQPAVQLNEAVLAY